MFRFNLFIIVLLFSMLSLAEEVKESEIEKSDLKQSYFITSFSYFSWTEKVQLDQGALSEDTRSQFSGTGLHFERPFYWSRWGLSPELSFLSGGATGGGTTSTVPYTASRVNFWGAHLQVKSDYRVSPRLILSMGPGLLYRNVKFQNDNPSLKVTSGADYNTTFIGEIKIRLSPKWDLRQQFGAVLFNAYVYWGIGLGYRF